MTTTNVWFNGPADQAEAAGIEEARLRGLRDPVVVRVVNVGALLGVVVADGAIEAAAAKLRTRRGKPAPPTRMVEPAAESAE